MKRSLFALSIVIALLLVGCGAPSTTSGDSTTVPNAPTDEYFEIPGTLSAENFDLKIVSAELCESVTLDGGGVDFPINADEGKQLLVLSIDATNTSKELRNLGSFLTYVDTISVLPNNYLGKYGERVVFVGAVHPGKTIGTYSLYQVPAEWKDFELSYVDSMTAQASKTIKISRSDIK